MLNPLSRAAGEGGGGGADHRKMLFNSQVFICGFLPIVLALYYACAEHRMARQAIVVAASLFFYGWWDIRFVPLLAGLTVANWLIARWFAASPRQLDPHSRRSAEPRRARPVQIRRLLPRHRRRAAGRGVPSLEPDPASRHQLFRVPEDLLPDRSPPRRPAHLRLPRLLHVRHLLPAAHRRPDRPPQRDHPPVRPRSAPAGDVGEPVARLRAVRDRGGEEGGTGRHAGDAGRSAVRASRSPRRCPRPRPGSPPPPTRCRSISTSPAIPTWRSGWR